MCQPVIDARGRFLGTRGTNRDVTERVMAEEQLHLAATVFANTSEAVMITDAENRVLTINPAFCEITGYRHGDMGGPRLLQCDQLDEDSYRDCGPQSDPAAAGRARYAAGGPTGTTSLPGSP
jgi:PAS domain-containing protein